VDLQREGAADALGFAFQVNVNPRQPLPPVAPVVALPAVHCMHFIDIGNLAILEQQLIGDFAPRVAGA
jgi:hypothetical protein